MNVDHPLSAPVPPLWPEDPGSHEASRSAAALRRFCRPSLDHRPHCHMVSLPTIPPADEPETGGGHESCGVRRHVAAFKRRGHVLSLVRVMLCQPLVQGFAGNPMECGGKRSATPLWLGTLNRARKRRRLAQLRDLPAHSKGLTTIARLKCLERFPRMKHSRFEPLNRVPSTKWDRLPACRASALREQFKSLLAPPLDLRFMGRFI
jgi:hypothetical protein